MKKIFLVLAIILFFFSSLYSQITYPVRFVHQPFNYNNTESFLLGLPNNEALMFWYDSTSAVIRYARGNNDLLNWYSQDSISYITASNKDVDINAIVLGSGRILLTYKTMYYYFIYSDNNGISWSAPTQLPTRSSIAARRKVYNSSLSIKSDGQISFVHSFTTSTNSLYAKGIFSIYSSDGINWSSVDTIDITGNNGNIINAGNSKDILVYQDSTENGFDIFFRTSFDNSLSWSDKSLLVGGVQTQTNPLGVKDINGKIWIYYLQKESTPFNNIYQSDIKFITSNDGGLNWIAPENFTKYVGFDINHKISLWNGRPVIAFSSSRNFNYSYYLYQIYFSLADIEIDNNVPPFLYDFNYTTVNPGPNVPYNIQAFVNDDKVITSVKLTTYKNPPGVQEIIEMYDDGAHNDSLAGDKIYGASITPQNYGDWISYNFIVEDNDSNIVEFAGSFIEVPFVYASDSYLFNINNLSLPLDNRGILAAVNVDGKEGLDFEESSVLFSGGFYLSGLNNGVLWANAVASASLVQDYQAGPVGTEPTDPFNKIYVIKNSDPVFGPSWQVFEHAVEQGADYYDGNNDGVYDPIDLNGNSIWDLNEDRPDFLGDLTAWCVYNDAIPSSIRRWNDQQPMGIEIQQTLFAWGENVSDPIDNMIFIRYRILNKATISNKFDSVYFSCWADPDLGVADDDLVGCDTQLNLGYTYNDGPDNSYGTNPPVFGIPFLQGPAAFIPGETFVDNNGNELYDEGTDTPLDTAYMNNGSILGIETLPGAKNQVLSSFIHYINADPILNDPNVGVEARNYMLGRTKTGESIDPCTWSYGFVFDGVNCATVDPRFLYSGNPVNHTGWINTLSSDQRILVNTGPFNLEENKPIDIVVCYLVGRGYDVLNSISVLKNISAEAIQIYTSNFTDIPTVVEDQSEIVKEFKLSQNYPNPFNPSTKINWQSPVSGHQTLKIYDVLGNEVVTLVNEYRNAGSYETDFNASSLSSGIYFYRLSLGSFIQTKKMLLIK